MAAGAFCAKTAWGDDPKASQQPGRVVSPKSPPIRSRAPGALQLIASIRGGSCLIGRLHLRVSRFDRFQQPLQTV